jgi:hypothetical protein
VWGIKEGRQCAEEVDAYLMHSSRLPFQGGIARRAWLAPPVTKQIGQLLQETTSDRGGMDSEAVSVAASA